MAEIKTEDSVLGGDVLVTRREEALGFFGSRLVNPKRRCTSLDEWAWHFERSDAPQRRQSNACSRTRTAR